MHKSNASSGQKMPTKLRLKLANECQDLLTKVKLNSNRKYRFHLIHSKHLNQHILDKLMLLFESLMRDKYERSSWGWNEETKLAEWKHPKTRLIIVTKNDICDASETVTSGQLPDDEDEIIGFMCFRYETGADKGECALYVYELHIDTEYQRQGLGEELMRMARVSGLEFKMDKIMLTVFRSNKPALQFYNKLKFMPDKSSPSLQEADYVIMSSKLKGQ